MPRILAIDYGTKRCGIAVTDNLQIIATGLTTVATGELFNFIKEYTDKEEVIIILVGDPKKLDNTPSESAQHVVGFVRKLAKTHPAIKIELLDERFTSSMAFQTMIDGGTTKKQRQNKETIDKISATILLQNYLETKKF
ncbi:MAG TPA: Holliday junction resolvase RuvX [Bacteroidia bacterium]|jgi:putative Holliday junction resolvase|nr:Holliday junction resolvase RuvX [Bacteroidia bacterium]